MVYLKVASKTLELAKTPVIAITVVVAKKASTAKNV